MRLTDLHDLHHERFSVNFGVLGMLDRLHGTFAAKLRPCDQLVKAH